jgi:CDP-diacylglycerol--serine O-phosphatidyltransferase
MALSLLMVSNLRYHSFKEVDLKGNVPFITIFLVVFIYALIAWDPPKILFSIFFLYMLSGLFGFFRRKLPSSKQNQSKIIAIK